MKRYLPLLCALLLLLLSACGPAGRDTPPEPAETETLELESLSVEVSRGELSTEELARAVRELPEALKTALAAQGVEAETVTVSVSSSPEASVQAVLEGGVDLAFLENGVVLEEAPRPLLAAVPASEEEPDLGAMKVIVRPDDGGLSTEAFAGALAAAVNGLREDQPVFGPYDYAYVDPDEGT